ncbi:MAG: hypothetical protein M1546_25695, partial [Chloroflexi bacterium]|nr:hypothetical protein [Chloroflexota bacterium]
SISSALAAPGPETGPAGSMQPRTASRPTPTASRDGTLSLYGDGQITAAITAPRYDATRWGAELVLGVGRSSQFAGRFTELFARIWCIIYQ